MRPEAFHEGSVVESHGLILMGRSPGANDPQRPDSPCPRPTRFLHNGPARPPVRALRFPRPARRRARGRGRGPTTFSPSRSLLAIEHPLPCSPTATARPGKGPPNAAARCSPTPSGHRPHGRRMLDPTRPHEVAGATAIVARIGDLHVSFPGGRIVIGPACGSTGPTLTRREHDRPRLPEVGPDRGLILDAVHEQTIAGRLADLGELAAPTCVQTRTRRPWRAQEARWAIEASGWLGVPPSAPRLAGRRARPLLGAVRDSQAGDRVPWRRRTSLRTRHARRAARGAAAREGRPRLGEEGAVMNIQPPGHIPAERWRRTGPAAGPDPSLSF